jgi:hypothetical protein
MDKEYTVLWIDDQYQKLIEFRLQAKKQGVLLVPFASFEEGFNHLERHLSEFDAILLDGMFFEKKDQVQGTEDETALGLAIGKLNQLKSKKVFPWFVLSGKESFTKSNNLLLKADKKRCYDKTVPGDLQELLEAIRQEADKLVDTQVKHNYQQVFDVCKNKYIGDSAAEDLMVILKSIGNVEAEFKDVPYFNRLRTILESVFRAANKFGLLHDACIPGGIVNLKNSHRFLSQNKVKISDTAVISCSVKHMPVIIERNLKNLLDITNVASHTEPQEKEQSQLELTAYRKMVHSPYLLYSLTFQLMDVLLWFKAYVDENNNVEINRSYWQIFNDIAKPIHTGVLAQDANGNYYCDTFLLPYHKIQNNSLYKIGDQINIIKDQENSKSQTKGLYPRFAITFEKANPEVIV